MGAETRERIVATAAQLFMRQGLTGTGLKQITTQAAAPFGSLYHFFPGGKDELAAEVIGHAGGDYQALVEAVWDGAPNLERAILDVFEGAAAAVEASGYADACPIATVALEVASTNEALRLATAEVFAAWVASLQERLCRKGIPAAEAPGLAQAIIALLEGGFLLARASRSTAPLLAAGRAAADAAKAARRRR